MQVGLLITDTEDDLSVEIGAVPNGNFDEPARSAALTLGSVLMDIATAMNGPHYREVGRLLAHITTNLRGDDHGSDGHYRSLH